jgi:5-formyltetrahydrofolate cyclo-ligase
MDAKKDVRRRVKAAMEAQGASDRAKKSAAIAEKLFSHEAFGRAKCVAFYVSMPHEVATDAMIDRAISEGKRVTVPRCDMETVELTFHEIADRSMLQAGTWGILEPGPRAAKVVHPDALDFVVVPGVAFDRAGNRIGNGKGFYDKFLKKLRPGTPKVALAYAIQLVPEVPVEPHDVKLDGVLTD